MPIVQGRRCLDLFLLRQAHIVQSILGTVCKLRKYFVSGGDADSIRSSFFRSDLVRLISACAATDLVFDRFSESSSCRLVVLPKLFARDAGGDICAVVVDEAGSNSVRV